MPLAKRCIAELIGTFWLVFGGCGSAILAASYTETAIEGASVDVSFSSGIGVLGVAIAFGLTVLTMAYAVGHISGGHFNPAVSFGLYVGKRFSGSDLLPYMIAQVLGAILAGGLLFIVVSAKGDLDLGGSNPLATNGYGQHSPDGYGLLAALIVETLMTFMFLLIILGSTDERAPQGFAPIAIGLGLTLIHLISIPVTNTSVNPARSTGVALFAGSGVLIAQLWVFWLAPIIGAVLAGFVYNSVFAESRKE